MTPARKSDQRDLFRGALEMMILQSLRRQKTDLSMSHALRIDDERPVASIAMRRPQIVAFGKSDHKQNQLLHLEFRRRHDLAIQLEHLAELVGSLGLVPNASL
jgi:hypothetical protein